MPTRSYASVAVAMIAAFFFHTPALTFAQSPTAKPPQSETLPATPEPTKPEGIQAKPKPTPETLQAKPPQPETVQATKIESATLALQQFLGKSDQRIPAWVLQKAQGIAIIPKVVQAGFFLGGRRGSGILMVRNDRGKWSNPAFISLTGGSFGFQFGAQTSDVVLVFMDQSAAYNALFQSFKLGGNISVAAGPVGGDIVSTSDPSPQIFTYARNQGLFAGVALEGAKIAFDQESSDRYYGQTNLTALQIFKQRISLNTGEEVADLQQLIDRSAGNRPGQAISSNPSIHEALP
jgi:SH3 domain-containing YSC84-like protein 1